MRCALDAIQLMQIVGKDTKVVQCFRQPLQGIGIVIDAGQQDGLVEQGRFGLTQAPQCGPHIRSEFIAMVGMDDHGHRPRQSGQPIQKLGIDTFRQDHRQTGMQTQAFQMWQGFQGFGQ